MRRNKRGFKLFNRDWISNDVKYEVGKSYEEDVIPKYNALRVSIGITFCTELKNCFLTTSLDSDNKIAEVIAYGDIDYGEDGLISYTNKIKIVREIPWQDVLDMVNTGKDCTGYNNEGNRNSGDENYGILNSGDGNRGNFNSGDRNIGDRNSGNDNSGDSNSGDHNSYDHNSGNHNSGICNSGNHNSGNYNSGDYNSGHYNSGSGNSGYGNVGILNSGKGNLGGRNSGNGNGGYNNSGNANCGNSNIGNANCGHHNIGHHNTGNWNLGNFNSGDWNDTAFSNGCFNTEEPKIMLFNKPSDWTYKTWLVSDAIRIMEKIERNVLEWVCDDEMSIEEKKANTDYEVTGGYLKTLNESECTQVWWNSLSNSEKKIIRAIPNFDEAIFKQVTGIKSLG